MEDPLGWLPDEEVWRSREEEGNRERTVAKSVCTVFTVQRDRCVLTARQLKILAAPILDERRLGGEQQQQQQLEMVFS